MAYQICPQCKHESFLWVIEHDDPYIETKWHCSICKYTAYEDERLERVCLICDNKTESAFKDDEKEYWWCFTCDATHDI